MPDSGVLDELRLLDRVGGDRRALAKLVRIFQADSRLLLSRVRAAVEKRSAQELRTAAHALKGSVANFAAPAATGAAARLQEMGERGDLAEASLVYASLEQELARVREGLATIVAGGRGHGTSRSTSSRPGARRPPARLRNVRR